MPSVLDRIPSASEVLENPQLKSLLGQMSRSTVVSGVSRFLEDLRLRASEATGFKLPTASELAERIASWIALRHGQRPGPVINATGNLLDPTLGSPPLSASALEAMVIAGSGYYTCAQARPGSEKPAAGQAETSTRPTMSLSPLCALAAGMGVLRAVRLVLGLGKLEPDSLVEYCGFTHRSVTSPLIGNPNCRFDHRRWRTAAAERPLGEHSASELFRLAGLDEAAAGAGLSVSGAMFVERAVCLNCSANPRVRRFMPDSATTPCLMCGGPAVAEPFRSHRTVTVRRLGGSADRPLALLGIGSDRDADDADAGGPRSVVLHDGRESVLVYRSASNPLQSPQ